MGSGRCVFHQRASRERVQSADESLFVLVCVFTNDDTRKRQYLLTNGRECWNRWQASLFIFGRGIGGGGGNRIGTGNEIETDVININGIGIGRNSKSASEIKS